jgi:NAD(P)-dependent dehydrogenase (short-subunit alcohol dehydrogenase family)
VISSIYAFTNGVGAVPYAMSKAAVEQFGRALRLELSPHGASASVAYFGFIDTEMVHRAIDQDPLANEMLSMFPKALHKRLAPAVAGEAIVRGIERRQARIIRPHRWVVMSVLRGVLGPLGDARAERDETAMKILREIDARSGEDQPLTA